MRVPVIRRIATWGQGEIISPCGLQGQSPCFWCAFTKADLRSKFAPRTTLCAPQGHALGGRMPDTHLVAWITMRKNTTTALSYPVTATLTVAGYPDG